MRPHSLHSVKAGSVGITLRPRFYGVELMILVLHLLGHFTFWISLTPRLLLSPKFGLRPKMSQKVKSFFDLVSVISLAFS